MAATLFCVLCVFSLFKSIRLHIIHIILHISPTLPLCVITDDHALDFTALSAWYDVSDVSYRHRCQSEASTSTTTTLLVSSSIASDNCFMGEQMRERALHLSELMRRLQVTSMDRQSNNG